MPFMVKRNWIPFLSKNGCSISQMLTTDWNDRLHEPIFSTLKMKNWAWSFLIWITVCLKIHYWKGVKFVNLEGVIQSNIWETACSLLSLVNYLSSKQGHGTTWLWAWSFLQWTKCLSEDTWVQVDVYLWTHIRVTRPSVVLLRQRGAGVLFKWCLHFCSAALEKQR